MKIANALSVQTDELLYDTSHINNTPLKNEIAEILNSSSNEELLILTDVLKTVKSSLEKYHK